MQEYFINVLLGMVPVTMAFFAVCIGGFFFRKKLNTLTPKGYKYLCAGSFTAWVTVLFFALTSPSITYKHEPFDKLQEQNKVEMINKREQESPRKIQDLSKPIEPSVENFEKLVDYKE